MSEEKCEINISDDLEYLCDSNYFTQNLGKHFSFEDNEANRFSNKIKDSSKHRRRPTS